jgi:hypothetical protein
LKIEPDNRKPLLVWKSIESHLPGLAAMARDLLCIPIAGVGVERVFSLARDMCGYRRGQLQPQTIRALLLLYFSLVVESRVDELQKELYLTMNIDDMTEQEMEAEISAREEDINIRQDKIDTWDEDHYISDEDTEPFISKTTRISDRIEYIARKRRRQNFSTQGQELSVLEESQRQELRRQLAQHDQRNRLDPSLWDIDVSDKEDSEDSGGSGGSREYINRGIDNVVLELPSLLEAGQSRKPKRLGRDILDSFRDKRQRQM